MTYEMHIRSQHAKQGRSGFGGPDTYVAVTAAPNGAKVPAYLNSNVLSARGIGIRYFGDGYSRHKGPKSQLGRAIRAAREYVQWKNYVERAWAEREDR